jgi:trehalose/maltose hydrolase-like predicted phosphorylase
MDKNHVINNRYVSTMLAMAFLLALAALRVGTAELAAMAVLLREMRRWNS